MRGRWERRRRRRRFLSNLPLKATCAALVLSALSFTCWGGALCVYSQPWCVCVSVCLSVCAYTMFACVPTLFVFARRRFASICVPQTSAAARRRFGDFVSAEATAPRRPLWFDALVNITLTLLRLPVAARQLRLAVVHIQHRGQLSQMSTFASSVDLQTDN